MFLPNKIMSKKISNSRKAFPSRSMGPHVLQVIPSAISNIDPFVFLDHFGPFEKTPDFKGVPPHPHAGIATITYLLSGSNRHQDSRGHDALIEAGDLAWMRAGKGIVHAEGMNENSSETQIIHGLQFWISLPAKDKFIEPAFNHYPNAVFPRVIINDVEVKVIYGDLLGAHSPVESLSPTYMYELKMSSDSSVHLPITEGYTCGLYVVKGSVNADDHRLLPCIMTRFETEGEGIDLSANEESLILVFGGEPLNEPIVEYGPFVMNSQEQIAQVIHDYEAGKMGEIQ
ncbi:MAG: pirin family protein [Crocinitomicaceae bacterium]|nr:pirin family protein [Crocinitomicaceae bacterium]